MADDQVYGFGKNDADAVIRLIGGNGGEMSQFKHPLDIAGTTGLYRFALTGAWSSNVATATIKTMAGTTVETSSVSDPEVIFSDLGSGDTGLCLLQGGVYYVIQAPCP